MPKLHIVASCTDKKRLRPASFLQVRSLRGKGRERRMTEWWARLQRPDSTLGLPAGELYVGNHWAVVRELVAVAASKGYEAKLWAMSAGYGLVSSSRAIRPYSATFAIGHPDSVATDTDGNQRWWASLGRRPWTDGGGDPRTVAALASADRDATILVIGSGRYVLALEQDLRIAGDRLADKGRLVLVSNRRDLASSPLAERCLPSDASLKDAVGGQLTALHARVARHVLSTLPGPVLDVRKGLRITEALERTPIARRTGQTLDDLEVRKWVECQLSAQPQESCTGLLRRLRASGLSCEEKRFRRLFRTTLHEGKTLYGT